MGLPAQVARLASLFQSLFRRARDDRDGVIAIMTALLGTVLIGGSALAVDVSYWRYRQEMLQNAADAVAAAAVYDLADGVSSQATLASNATYEAQRNGCYGNCTVAVTWPYNGLNTEVQVTLTDSNAHRFFSYIYSNGAKVLQGRSVAGIAQSGTTTTTHIPDSACILALSPSASQAFYAFNGQSQSNPNGVVNPNCEVIVDSNSSDAIDLENYSEIAGKATTPGQIVQRNQWTYVGTPNPGAKSIPDPYAGHVSLPSSGAGPCNDPTSGTNIQPININGGSGPAQSGESQGASAFVNTGGSTWTISGAGGHWCDGWNLNNVTLDLGPGTYYIDGQLNGSGTTINATSSGGATLVFGAPQGYFNLNYQNGSVINITAPPLGATEGVPGIAITNYTDDQGGRTIYFQNNIQINYTGTIYFPKNNLYIQNNGLVNAIQGPEGCGHIIANTVVLTNQISVGDTCTLAMGVQPFGTAVSANPWGGTTTTSTSTGASRPVFIQ